MTEIEELKSRVQSLEKQMLGGETAVINLTLAICSSARLDLRSVESGFREMCDALKSTYLMAGDEADRALPMERIHAVLASAADAVDKEKASTKAD